MSHVNTHPEIRIDYHLVNEGTKSAYLGMDPPLVILDPGHGGSDPGTVSVTGQNVIYESKQNLLLSLTLKAELIRVGFLVMLTRTGNALPGGVTVPADSFPYRCEAMPVSFASVSVHHDVRTARTGGCYYNPDNPISQALAQRIARLAAGWCRPDTQSAHSSLYMVRHPRTPRCVLWEAGPLRTYPKAVNRIQKVNPVVMVLCQMALEVGVM